MFRIGGLDDSGRPDNKVHKGQIVIDRSLSADVRAIFKVAYDNHFPIHSVIPVSAFDWSDPASMDANNSSGFNYRPVGGTNPSCSKITSRHASTHSGIGAFDINPRQNPYKTSHGVKPKGALYDPKNPGTLTSKNPVVVKAKELHWTWGNDFEDPQHFQKILE